MLAPENTDYYLTALPPETFLELLDALPLASCKKCLKIYNEKHGQLLLREDFQATLQLIWQKKYQFYYPIDYANYIKEVEAGINIDSLEESFQRCDGQIFYFSTDFTSKGQIIFKLDGDFWKFCRKLYLAIKETDIEGIKSLIEKERAKEHRSYFSWYDITQCELRDYNGKSVKKWFHDNPLILKAAYDEASKNCSDARHFIAVAIRFNNIDQIKCLLDKNSDHFMLKGCLKLAVQYGHENIVQYLLSCGAIAGFSYGQLTKFAIDEGQAQLVQVLRNNVETACYGGHHGTWIDRENFPDVLDAALSNNNSEIFQMLFSPKNTSAVNQEYLVLAIRKKADQITNFFINQKISLDKEYGNDTPLTAAIKINDSKTVKVLLKAGANPDVTPKNGYSPLMLAINQKDLEIIKIIRTHTGAISRKVPEDSEVECFARGDNVPLKYFLKKFPDQDPIYDKVKAIQRKLSWLMLGSVRDEIIEERSAKNTMQALLKLYQDKPALERAKILFRWYLCIAKKNEKAQITAGSMLGELMQLDCELTEKKFNHILHHYRREFSTVPYTHFWVTSINFLEFGDRNLNILLKLIQKNCRQDSNPSKEANATNSF